MRAPTNYAGPRRDDDKTTTVSQSEHSNLAQGPATVQNILERKGNQVFSVKPEDSLQTAVNRLGEKRIGALVVLDDTGHLAGVLSERDIVRKMADMPDDVLSQRVDSLMTRKVKVCRPEDQLLAVLKVMTEGRFRHMPVVKDDHLLGVVTIGDVVHERLGELELEAIKMKQMIVG
ncbi:MAG: CBS domain-containing protein [Pseudomonadota bacterium]